MKLIVEKTETLHGSVAAPPSKSHTHRAVVIASLATGESEIGNPSLCDDCLATIDACKMFGAKIEGNEELRITGVGGKPTRSDIDVNARNSGTTMRFMTAVFALCKGGTTITCDESLRSRPIAPLLKSLADLGAVRVKSLNSGCPPVIVTGKMTGGSTNVDGDSSQYASALLLACPLAGNDTMLNIGSIKSRPYVNMTLEHLERVGARIWSKDLSSFFIPGGQPYRATEYTVPGDYSSAAFLTAAAHITGSDIEITGLDPNDTQGDRAMAGMTEKLLSGDSREIDLGDNPDLLPVLAVLGCYAGGTSVFNNVAHARQKESDRITAICTELKKMGANIEETADGVIVRSSALNGAELDGHGDHRIVMALAVAALGAEGRTVISGAETVSKSYPNFIRDLAGLGANIREAEE